MYGVSEFILASNVGPRLGTSVSEAARLL